MIQHRHRFVSSTNKPTGEIILFLGMRDLTRIGRTGGVVEVQPSITYLYLMHRGLGFFDNEWEILNVLG